MLNTAACRAGDQHKLVGRYESAEAAARAYDQAAVALHGPEAFTNFSGQAQPDLWQLCSRHTSEHGTPYPAFMLRQALQEAATVCLP